MPTQQQQGVHEYNNTRSRDGGGYIYVYIRAYIYIGRAPWHRGARAAVRFYSDVEAARRDLEVRERR